MLMQNFQKFKGINMNWSCIKNVKYKKNIVYQYNCKEIICKVIKINIH